MTAIERFHARKYRDQQGSKADKRAILKVSSAGSSKKQKMLVKSCVQDALKELAKDRGEEQELKYVDVEPMETLKVVTGMEPHLLEADPKTLMGTQGESHQEK
jgi:hypothetical protein